MGASSNLFLQLREQESILASNKQQREDYAKAIVQQVADGEQDAIKAFIFAKKGAEVFTTIEKNLRPYVQAKQLPKGGYELYDTKFVEKSDPTKYDFTKCGDAVWEDLKRQEAEVKEKLKERETFLKTIKETVFNGDGEPIEPPEVITGAINFSVTLK